MRVKRKDGSIVEITDRDYLLDGEALVVPMQLMDSKPKAFTDSAGNPSGCRPGFLFRDDGVAHAVSETVHKEYCDAISERWKSDRWSAPHRSAPLAPSFANADAASVGAAYSQYETDLCNRWKSR